MSWHIFKVSGTGRNIKICFHVRLRTQIPGSDKSKDSMDNKMKRKSYKKVHYVIKDRMVRLQPKLIIYAS